MSAKTDRLELNNYPLLPPDDSCRSCEKWSAIITIAISSIVALGAMLLIIAHNGHNLGPFSELATVIEYKWACLTLPLASVAAAIACFILLSLKPQVTGSNESLVKNKTPTLNQEPGTVISSTKSLTSDSGSASNEEQLLKEQEREEIGDILLNSNLDLEEIGGSILKLLHD